MIYLIIIKLYDFDTIVKVKGKYNSRQLLNNINLH